MSLKKQNTLKENDFPLSSHQRAFPFKLSDVQCPTDVTVEAEMRTDAASAAGGDTDLCRTQLRM